MKEEANLLFLHKTTSLTKRTRGRPSASESIKHARLSSTVFVKSKCVFCQRITGEEEPKVHEKLRKGQFLVTWEETIQEIVNSSHYDAWNVRLADVLSSGDLLSRDILYQHTSRFTKKLGKVYSVSML